MELGGRIERIQVQLVVEEWVNTHHSVRREFVFVAADYSGYTHAIDDDGMAVRPTVLDQAIC